MENPAATDNESPIVVFGDDWQRFVSTLQHLFAHIVDRRRVLWVNSFGHRTPRLSLYDFARAARKMRLMLRDYPLRKDGSLPPAQIIEPRALPWHNLSIVRRFNAWSLRRDILRALASIAPDTPPVLVTGTPAAEGVVGTLGECASIYFCMDNYGELPGVDRRLVAPLEDRLLAKVDATVATAAELTVLKRPASGRAYQLPQGVNYDRFAAPRAIPADLAALPRPRVGFAGTLSAACDFDIFRALVASFPTGSVVHVGPVQPGIDPRLVPGLRSLGHRAYDVLPAYVQHFDVGIVPYTLNDWTRSVDPLKLLEYLAAGIPVVTTPIPEVHKYARVISVASDTSAFVTAAQLLSIAPDPVRRAERQALAQANTWKRRADRFLEIVAEVTALSADGRAHTIPLAPRHTMPSDPES